MSEYTRPFNGEDTQLFSVVQDIRLYGSTSWLLTDQGDIATTSGVARVPIDLDERRDIINSVNKNIEFLKQSLEDAITAKALFISNERNHLFIKELEEPT